MFERLGHIMTRVMGDLVAARADRADHVAGRPNRDHPFCRASLAPRVSTPRGGPFAVGRHERRGGSLRALRPVQ